jgi:hypothetical protein
VASQFLLVAREFSSLDFNSQPRRSSSRHSPSSLAAHREVPCVPLRILSRVPAYRMSMRRASSNETKIRARRARAPNIFLACRDARCPTSFAHRVGHSLVLQLVSRCCPIRVSTRLWSCSSNSPTLCCRFDFRRFTCCRARHFSCLVLARFRARQCASRLARL